MKRREVSGDVLFAVIATAILGGWRAPRGFSNLDEGYLPALAARLLDGEALYRDAIYVRPPLSPWLHAAIAGLTPGGWGLLASRWTGIAFLVITVTVTVRCLLPRQAGDERAWGLVERYGLATAALALSLLSFPPMAWHTLDGLLFGAVGLACITGQRIGASRGLLGGIALGAAALAKQSFFPLPLIAVGVLLLRGREHRRSAAVVATGVAVAVITALAILAATGSLSDALAQTLRSVAPGGFWQSGVRAWFRPAVVWGLPLGALVIGARATRRDVGRGAALVLAITGPALLQLRADIHSATFVRPVENFPAGWCWLALGLTLCGIAVGSRRRVDLAWRTLPFLGLAWCASISWGYATPALGATAAIVAIWRTLKPVRLVDRGLLALVIAAVGLVNVTVGAWLHPYGEAPLLKAETRRLDRGCEEGRGVSTSARNLAVWLALREGRGRHPGSFAVLPGLPAAHLCLGETPPIPSDWTRNAEIGLAWPRLREALDQRVDIAFVEQAKIDRPVAHPVGSRAVDHVVKGWREVERGDIFVIYENPGSASRRSSEDTSDGRD